MLEKSCCFTGHRGIPDTEKEYVFRRIREEVVNLISRGVNTFYCGGAVGFDTVCGKIIISLKESFPSVKLFLALPCPEQNKYFNSGQNEDYKFLKENADKVYYASDHYHAGCMHERNRFMVDLSENVICYCKKSSGGTFYTVKYAAQKNRNIISI